MSAFLFPALSAAAGAWFGWNLPRAALHLSARKTGKPVVTPNRGSWLSSVPAQPVSAVCIALVWVFSSLQMENPVSAVLVSLLITAASLIALIDLLIRIVPNELVLTVLVLGGAFQLVQYDLRHLLYAGLSLFFFLLLFLLTAVLFGLDKIGAGDVKLAGAMGLVLGFPFSVEAFAIMGISVLLFCLIGFSVRKLKRTSLFPFAPFMMLGMSASLIHIVLVQ